MKLLGSLCLLVLCLGISSQKALAQTRRCSIRFGHACGCAELRPQRRPHSTRCLLTSWQNPKHSMTFAASCGSSTPSIRCWCCWRFWHLGIAAKYRDWAERVSKHRFVQALIFVPLFMLTLTVLGLPLDAYQQHISRQYGLSVQGWGSWFGDVAKGQAVSLIILILAIWGITNLIRKSPRRWWFYTWLVAVPFVIFLIFLSPLVIDPLFNKFEPLDKSNPQLVDAIQQVTKRGGLEIPRDRMFLMKASEKVTTLNAYVTGFGPSKRVVVWDTTIQHASTPETLFVFGHEMGHYVLNHIVIGIAATAVGLFIGFYLLYWIANWAFPRFQQRWRMRELSDWAAVPMLILIFSSVSTYLPAHWQRLQPAAGAQRRHIWPGSHAWHQSQLAGSRRACFPGAGRVTLVLPLSKQVCGVLVCRSSAESMSACLLPITTIRGAKASSQSM